jgi:hypothetical protein
MPSKKLNIFLSFILISIFVFLFYKVVKVDNNEYMPSEKQENTIDSFNLKTKIVSIKSDSILKNFPYELYIKNANTSNIFFIKRDLSVLDSLYPSKSVNRHVLSIALTKILEKEIDLKFEEYKADSLIYLLQWAERFKNYSEIDVENKLLFISIYDHWLNYIGNALTRYSNKSPGIKNDFKFRFLVAKCSEKNFNISIKVTPIEKIVYNLISNNWGHLLDASWLQASVVQKIAILFLLLLTIFSYIIMFRFFLKSKK